MKGFFMYLVFSALFYILSPTGAYPQPGFDSRSNRTRRGISCNADLEYPHGSICCLSCPPGKYVKSTCTKAGEMGACEECSVGTYAEHANGLQQCFRCTLCRSDQEVVRPCSPTQNTECQCKPGLFCHPDHACEVCKKCSRCESDEEEVRNCTATTNTECKKIQSKSSSTLVVLVVLAFVLLAVSVAVVVIYKKKCRTTDSQTNLPGGIKPGSEYAEGRKAGSTNLITRPLVRPKSYAGMEDEHKMLCETPSSSASNSQHSLTSPPCQFTTPLQASPAVHVWPNRREDAPFPILVPVNGEESLRSCFEYFEEVDVDHHKRFFRHLDFSDNMIKSKDTLQYEDKVHELLNMWVEREGKEASLNDLLKALLDLNQRRTAERIKEKAVSHHHYVCEC
ncbi:hematopoietic death receptor isoform X2 [Melanotaenia boesemani]|uniref:hematopoietic death receptor isoform X2 n=1 Tax=Melanotaenia boesemani TaxID=1250792 RepID=UPI001C052001|nr:hematopoietic death receptor isoform X2 [Melanotaenia boesemani]